MLSPTEMAVVTIAVSTFIYAVPCVLAGGKTRLTVYRSPECRVTDPSYAPVAELLGSVPFQHVQHDERPDPEMMFGRAILDVYEIGPHDDDRDGP
ncbi:hypothetical protein TIMSHEL_70 [Mycobacterium phage Timshel]|uniref:Uncharacterized protein n=1 Tax=Mycobacterium phage Timshel TaxID=1032895 RepID=G1DB88_9CAUD|nr:hypothetical protein FDI10_gp24 [Mycobacterium phage Timshel]AEJ92364.1 hypothetical protein TIMSHEL_70 [Mycobacterium phage Timshel]